MAAAKTLFLERINAFRRSTASEAVTNRILTERAHNEVARMLRNGLAVVGFAALEDFIKSRTSEVLTTIGTFGIPFSDLPEKLQQAATYEAIDAFSYQLQLLAKADRTAYIQEHSAKVASTAGTAWELTQHALGYSHANLTDATVKDILKAFSMNDAWRQMTRLGARLNLVSLPLDESFKNAARRRHRAAHTPQADTPQTDLQQYSQEALAIAIGFDSLICHSSFLLRTRETAKIAAGISDYGQNARVRVVVYRSGAWKEQLLGNARVIRSNADMNIVSLAARARAESAKEILVLHDQDGHVADWHCF